MSDHPLDQLSAFLDGELAPDARASVETHLRQCAACALHLEELAAVDTLARSVPAEAPAGYFQALPGRVVQRLPPRAARARAIPVWTWALAAGLIVAVAGPLVLQQHRASEPVHAPAEAPFAAVPQASTPEQPARRPAPETAAGPAATLARVPLQSAPGRGDAPMAPPRGADARRPEGFASAPHRPAEGGVVLGDRAKERDLAKDNGESREMATAPLPAPPAPPAATPPAVIGTLSPPAAAETRDQADEVRLETSVEEALAPAKKAEAERKEARQRTEANARGMAGGSRALASPAETRFAALSARVASSLEDARALREAWRGYVRQNPRDARSDEARVRLVEAGADAYRRSRAAEDLSVLRGDARAYLSRPDALQAPRVRGLLRELGLDPS